MDTRDSDMNMTVFFETAGVGGAVAFTAITTLVICYYLTLKWVVRGQEDNTDEN